MISSSGPVNCAACINGFHATVGQQLHQSTNYALAVGSMIIRDATRNDVPGLVAVRGGVKENILTSNIPPERIAAGLEGRGKGWVAEHEGQVVGFSMADREESTIWALFLLPEWERQGLGRVLLDRAVGWLWRERCESIWLTTEPGSRAEGFYSHLGWTRAGMTDKGEVRFELQRPSLVP